MSSPTGTIQLPATGAYEIDPAASTVAFTTRHMFGLGGVSGTFAVTGGTVTVADPPTDSALEATASAASFTTGTARRDTHVLSEDFLHADAHPDITFRSTAVVQAGAGWLVRGVLTVRGTGAPLDLDVTDVRTTATGLAMTATGTVDRYAHGLVRMKGMAGRRLRLTISAAARRA